MSVRVIYAIPRLGCHISKCYPRSLGNQDPAKSGGLQQDRNGPQRSVPKPQRLGKA